jgi:hypothetical protein
MAVDVGMQKKRRTYRRDRERLTQDSTETGFTHAQLHIPHYMYTSVCVLACNLNMALVNTYQLVKGGGLSDGRVQIPPIYTQIRVTAMAPVEVSFSGNHNLCTIVQYIYISTVFRWIK